MSKSRKVNHEIEYSFFPKWPFLFLIIIFSNLIVFFFYFQLIILFGDKMRIKKHIILSIFKYISKGQVLLH